MAQPGAPVKLDGRGAGAVGAAAMTDPARPVSLSAVLAPDACTTMADVRRGVDALDRDLVALLAVRFGYMRAAARIKPDRDAVRDEARKAAVIVNAVAHAKVVDAPADEIAALWEHLVEASIAYELTRFDARQK